MANEMASWGRFGRLKNKTKRIPFVMAEKKSAGVPDFDHDCFSYVPSLN